jgi:hypothetical protein
MLRSVLPEAASVGGLRELQIGSEFQKSKDQHGGNGRKHDWQLHAHLQIPRFEGHGCVSPVEDESAPNVRSVT